MSETYDLTEALDAIDPGALDYQQWTSVGMALKDAGHPLEVWENWSRRDGARFHEGECAKKWATFCGSSTPVTGGSIVALAREQGWTPPFDEGHELDWEDVIGARDEPVVIKDTAWVEDEDIPEPSGAAWDPVGELTTYLETLFEAGENVGYVAQSWERDGRHLPQKGHWDRTAGELVQALSRAHDIGAVIGDTSESAGAWIRFNPLDGQGCKNENVTDFRYALVESDTMPPGKQLAIIRRLELPCAVVVHSGKKSVHAIVRIDAPNYDEYRKRVDYLYDVCRKNGLAVDSQNKNPSRLSRMPGVTRNGRRQFIIDTNIGRESWVEWQEWIEAETDVLPVDITNGDAEWDEDLSDDPEIIEGLLSTEEKMMLAGPSKAGKSYALLELTVAIANGDTWMGARCTQGDVLYVNFELKTKGRKKRTRAIQIARGNPRSNSHRMHFLDLRGHSAPLGQLSAKIIRQAAKFRCSMIIIDPIYKVMTGDENNAEAVSLFCNQLDALMHALGCSIVYCHHYSKGQQGQKASMDRASGSGVFARDADGLLTMTELDVTDAMRKAYLNERECERIIACLDGHARASWRADVAPDALVVARDLRTAAVGLLDTPTMNALIAELDALGRSINDATAHRIEATLRDFAPHRPIDVWYRNPIHEVDSGELLKDAKFKDQIVSGHVRGGEKKAQTEEQKAAKKKRLFESALANAKAGEPVTRREVAEFIGEFDGKPVTKSTIRSWMSNWPEYSMSGPESGDVIIGPADGV